MNPNETPTQAPMQEAPPKRKWKEKYNSKWAKYAFVFALVVSTGGLGSLYLNAQSRIKTLESNPTEAAKTEVVNLVKKVGVLVELPKDETPTVATVTDVEKLKKQQFFTNTQQGDKVLIYSKSKKAILYRPSTNKIIEIAPINLGNDNK